MIFHESTGEVVIQSLESDLSNGLSSAQVTQRQQQYGPNRLRGKKKKSML